jgi:hypothetical protein
MENFDEIVLSPSSQAPNTKYYGIANNTTFITNFLILKGVCNSLATLVSRKYVSVSKLV